MSKWAFAVVREDDYLMLSFSWKIPRGITKIVAGVVVCMEAIKRYFD